MWILEFPTVVIGILQAVNITQPSLPQPAGADLQQLCDVSEDPTMAHTAWDDHGWLLHLAMSVKLFLILDKPGLHARKAAALIASFLHLLQALGLWYLHRRLWGCAGVGGGAKDHCCH